MNRGEANGAGAGAQVEGKNQRGGSPEGPEHKSSGTFDSVLSRDVEECARLLDEVWPQEETEAPGALRQLGRFSILGELGRGGFGVVFLAEDPMLGRRLALKVPRIEVLSESHAWRRFLSEVRTASRLDHPNLVPLLEAGTIGPVGYIASAFVAGPTLEHCLKRARSGAPARFSARLIATLAGALEHMHGRGILHRDLKPANILMQPPEGREEISAFLPWDGPNAVSWVPRICDFGLAKLRDLDGDETRSRSAAGSPPYMSPEQAEARHDELGPATDIYGLGATLYHLLTGRPPFSGASELETLRRVVADEPPRPRQLRRDLARDLETICLKCLAKTPAQRYGTAGALAEDLERFLEGRPILARAVPAWERMWKWGRRHPALAALASATVLAVIAAFAGIVWHESVLRQINEQLRLEATRAADNARDALYQRNLVEERERLLRRQLAGHQVFAAQQAVLAGNFELAHRMLDPADGAEPTPPIRGFAWSYLWRFVRDRLEVRPGHRGSLDLMAADPSGRMLATANDSGDVWLWDSLNERCTQMTSVHMSGTFRLAFSPDGRRLTACSHPAPEVFLWDAPSGTLLGQLSNGSTTPVSALLFVHDGKHLLAIREQGNCSAPPILGWDISSKSGPFHPLSNREIASISEELVDERLVMIAGLLEIAPREKLSAPALAELKRSISVRPPRGLACTRDGAMVVVAQGDGSLNVYRLASGFLLASCRFGTDGTSIVLHDPTQRVKNSQPQDRERPELMAKRLAARAPEQGRGSDLVVTLDWWDHFAYSADGRRLAVWREADDELAVIDLATGRTDHRYNLGKLDGQVAICFRAGGGTLALGGRDHVVRFWHLAPPQNPVMLTGHAPKEAWAVAFAPDGRTVASAGDDHCIRLWDVETGRARSVLRVHDALVSSVAFGPDGQTLISGSFDRKRPVVLCDIATGKSKFALRGHRGYVRAVAYSPDGRAAASGSDDKTIMVWDTNDGRCLFTLERRARINCLAFSPDGQTLAAGEVGGVISVVDVATHSSRTIGSVASVSSLTFSPDGARIYSGHDGGRIMIWDTSTGQRLTDLAGHYVNIYGVAASPDGTALASAGYDRTVVLWDPATGQQLLRLADCKAQVNAVAFSPDGQCLAAADHSGAITIWHAGRHPVTPADSE